MNNDINNRMTTNNNQNKQTQEDLLMRLVDMMDEGHQLTDEEMALLAANDEAVEIYMQLSAMKHVVGTPEPLAGAPLHMSKAEDDGGEARGADHMEEAKEDESGTALVVKSIRSWMWPVLAAAAVLLALVVITQPRHTEANGDQDLLLAYEHTEKPDGIILKTTTTQPIDITKKKNRLTRARLIKNKEQLVLDYQTPAGTNYSINHTVQADTIEVPCGKDFKLILADGTEVWLYADSRLIYPAQFVGDERRVFLDGEAYFRVAKDSEHPFIVSTDRMEARVLGTELNVNSRKNHVALITGSVEVSTGNTSHRQLLTPGQSASLADGGRLIVECENMESYVYWRNGYIYFDDATLTEIAQQLGRWFNVDVEVKNAQKQHLRLHFLYKRSDSMKRVVSILNNFGEFKAEYSNNCLRIK